MCACIYTCIIYMCVCIYILSLLLKLEQKEKAQSKTKESPTRREGGGGRIQWWSRSSPRPQQEQGEHMWREHLALLPPGRPEFACGWRQSCRKRTGLALPLLQLETSQQQWVRLLRFGRRHAGENEVVVLCYNVLPAICSCMWLKNLPAVWCWP